MVYYYIINAFLLLGCLVGGFFLVRAIKEVIRNARELKQLNNTKN